LKKEITEACSAVVLSVMVSPQLFVVHNNQLGEFISLHCKPITERHWVIDGTCPQSYCTPAWNCDRVDSVIGVSFHSGTRPNDLHM